MLLLRICGVFVYVVAMYDVGVVAYVAVVVAVYCCYSGHDGDGVTHGDAVVGGYDVVAAVVVVVHIVMVFCS